MYALSLDVLCFYNCCLRKWRKEYEKTSIKIIVPTVLDLGLRSIAYLGPRASTKVESHVNFTESQNVSQPIFFAMLNTKKFATINFNLKHFQFTLNQKKKKKKEADLTVMESLNVFAFNLTL